MKALLELATLINRNKTKSLSVIGKANKKGTKLERFYYHLSRGDITTDEDAMHLLYPGQKNRNSYYKLKHELIERLYNTAFFVDASKANQPKVWQADLECQSLLTLTRILVRLGAHQNALKTGKKALAIAEENEFTFESIGICYILEKITSPKLMLKESKVLLEKIERYSNLYQKEMIAEVGRRKMLLHYLSSRSAKKYVKEIAVEYLDKIAKLPGEETSSGLIMRVSALRIYKYFIANEYQETIEICRETIKLLDQRNAIEPWKFVAQIHLIASAIPLRRYQLAIDTIEVIKANSPEGSFNWQKAYELHLMVCFHAKDYPTAYDIFQIVTNHGSFKKVTVYSREVWIVYGAYFYLLNKAGLLPNYRSDGKTFKLQRYLNSVPVYSKDKRGFNVPILVSQILLLIQLGRYDDLTERFDAIAKYKDRYLDRENNFRSNLFISMLLQVAKGNMNPNYIERRVEKYRKRLAEKSIDITDQRYDQEILPYEDAWELTLHFLRKAQSNQIGTVKTPSAQHIPAYSTIIPLPGSPRTTP